MPVAPPAPPGLLSALVSLDEIRAVELLDEGRHTLGLSGLVQDLVMPVMREIGLAWERGEVSVAQEHLATQLVRGYLEALRIRSQAAGPQAWLACPPRELHDLPLAAFALLLQERGWHVRFFGASTPLHDLLRGVRVYRPELVVVSADDPDKLSACSVPLDLMSHDTVVALGGRAAQEVGADLPGIVLPPDMVAAADHLTRCFAPEAFAREDLVPAP
ncbi:cobalamin B12-binding domain-containing protein [Ornithinimicrobium cerasi]|uniref:Methanogenic corrinoid protein MtbC1 n=1 Tax=Ornithinimicrobium cerasi TaxID=2248773 RepID=A0A285VX93_9MICO|nr:B12-binding domain-containing protein [Ornithinimicrobium cerasi]SOC58208.1 Methanogenic corrinoid protein MtbC1 [Ornithinimicrobium cerasi]